MCGNTMLEAWQDHSTRVKMLSVFYGNFGHDVLKKLVSLGVIQRWEPANSYIRILTPPYLKFFTFRIGKFKVIIIYCKPDPNKHRQI